jgi:2-methylisocitrate lyase-like PEP mutase family enzyme
LHGHPDLDDTIKRLQAFEKAGADVLFAPGLPDLKAVQLVCSSLSKPVNFMVGIPGRSFSVAELQDAGVRRISLATSLHRAAMTGLYRAALQIKEQGRFDFLNDLVSPKELGKFLR